MENTYIELLGTGATLGYIYLSEDIPVPITFSIASIQDISQKNATFSKTISIPATKNNNKIFGHIFRINLTDFTYDINHKQQVKLVTNGTTLLAKAYLQLVNIRKVSNSSPQGDELMYYDCLLIDEKINLYDKLEGKLLEELVFTQNHVYNDNNILNSTGTTWQNEYAYPMYYGPSPLYYQTQDFLPSLFVRSYLEKIAIANDIQWSGFFNEEPVTKLLIPYNGDVPKIDQDTANSRMFQASVSGGTTSYEATRTANSNNYTSDTLSTADWYYVANAGSFPPSLFSGFGRTVQYNNDSTGSNFDSGSTYNTTLYRFTSPANGTYDFQVAFRGLFTWKPTVDGWLYEDSTDPANSGGTAMPFKVILVKNRAAVSTPAQLGTNQVGFFHDTETVKIPQRANITTSGPDVIGGNTYLKVFDFDKTFTNIYLGAGETLEVLFFTDANRLLNATTYWDSSAHVGQATNDDNIEIFIGFEWQSNTGVINRFRNYPYVNGLQSGDGIILNNFIPKQIKQKDFFASIVQMFNLFIEEDEDVENKFIVKSRPQFYSGNTFEDWTDLFAEDRENTLSFLSELQNKKLSFSYTPDKDPYNTNYSNNTGLVYGQTIVEFDNDFLQGERKIQPIFSPTPIQYNGFGLLVSAIDSAAPKNNIRIVYDGGVTTGGTWNFKGDFGVTQQITGYRVATHFDNPYDPTLDLNWEENDFYYYQLDQTTTNNLYQTYWYNYVDQIANGKMLTGYFDLNEKIIQNLNFASKIWVKDSYYYINKIIDYNATNPQLTKVELIKIDEGLSNYPRRNGKPVFPNGEQVRDIFKPSGPTGGGSSGGVATGNAGTLIDYKGRNQVDSDNTLVVLGERNVVGQDVSGVIIQGDDNTVTAGAKNALVVGNNNNIYFGAENVNIIGGSGNTVYDTVSGVTIIGTNDLTISGDSNSTYVAGIRFSEGVIYNPIISGITIADNKWSGGTGANSIVPAFQTGNTATGENTLIQGRDNSAKQEYAVTFGRSNLNGGAYSYVFGENNEVQTDYSGVFGGFNNVAVNQSDFILGGNDNQCNDGYGTILNGSNNITGFYGLVGGGTDNRITGAGYGAIINGNANSVSGAYGIILNGDTNNNTGTAATIINGLNNWATGTYSIVAGSATSGTATNSIAFGVNSKASGTYSTVINGLNNLASGSHSFVQGSGNTATGTNTVVMGGSGMSGTANNSLYTTNLRAGEMGGVIYSAGTPLHSIFLSTSTSGTSGNLWSASTGTNSIRQNNGTNSATNTNSVAIGSGNTVTGINSVALGGQGNLVSGNRSVVIGGIGITGSGQNTLYCQNLTTLGTIASAGDAFLTNVQSTGLISSGGTDLLDMFVQVGGTVTGSGTNNTVPLWNGTSGLDNSILTEASGVMTCGGVLSTTTGLRFPDQSTTTLTLKRVSIGDWDMNSNQNVSVAHGLSATEWKTIIGTSITVRNDADTGYYDLYTQSGSGNVGGSIDYYDSTNIVLFRGSTGGFNNTDFNSTSYNRGWVMFWYIPD